MTTPTPKFLNTEDAADLIGLSSGYMAYLRTDTAKEAGHSGPPYIRVDLRDGSSAPKRIKYDRAEILAWKAEKEALRNNPAIIERVAG